MILVFVAAPFARVRRMSAMISDLVLLFKPASYRQSGSIYRMEDSSTEDLTLGHFIDEASQEKS